VAARREAVPPYLHPVYGVPDDLVRVDLLRFGLEPGPHQVVGRVVGHQLEPYPDRREIEFGRGLGAPAEVLGYLADPVELFLLQVQGSGTLVFEDGSRLRAGYAMSNGRPYRSIGQLLVDEGLITREKMSMQAIRAYLAEHPEDLERVLSSNPSYVFFRPLEASGDGPLGCYGVPVTAGRSIATDRAIFPAPAVAWIQATIPDPTGGRRTIRRFVINQDTGGAIRGPGRVDLFVGAGESAGEVAGRMQDSGSLYLLLPRSI
jgi:membrane-bound lytic murein transglycosylase A